MENKTGFGEWVVRWRWWVIPGCWVVMFLIAGGGGHLSFSSDYRVFFSEENPQLRAFETLQNTYTKNDNVLIALAPENGQVFSRETLAVVEEVTRKAWQTPYSIRVDSITNFQHTWAKGDDLVVEDLVSGASGLTDQDLERVRKIALGEPLLINRLINPAADVTGVNITVQLPGKSNAETAEVVEFIRSLAEDVRSRHPGVKVYLTGVVFMNNAFNEAGQGDMKTLVPIMYLLVAVIMILALRSFWGAFVTILVVAFSVVTGMGLAGFLGIRLTPISASAPTIILTLAVADSIHILVTLFQEMRQGRPKPEAIAESLRINHQPVFITSLTTAIGFLSLNFSDSPPFRDLGNIVSMGVSSAYVYSIFLVPALMAVLPVRVKPRAQTGTEWMDRFADFVIAHRTRLFWGFFVLMAVAFVQIPRIEINEKFNEYFDTRYTFRTDNDFVIDHLTGFESIEYSPGAGESGGISNPEYLSKLEEFAEWYRQQPGVMYAGTLTDIMKRLNKNMHGDDPAYYRLPRQRDLAAQYLLLYELSLPFGLDLNNQINVDKSATRFTVILESVSTRHALDLEARAQDWLKQNAPSFMRSHGASPLIMFSHIAQRNIRSMLAGIFLALVLISLVMMAALRSVRFGCISLLPNLLPILVTFGIWGMFVREIGLAVSVVTPVALGIIIDDTVHFMSKYLRARKEMGKAPADAVRYSFHTVGMALWVTSVILVAGFAVLTFSGFRMNSQMGLITDISIVVALVADFLFLPPLLMKMEEKSRAGQRDLEEVPETPSP